MIIMLTCQFCRGKKYALRAKSNGFITCMPLNSQLSSFWRAKKADDNIELSDKIYDKFRRFIFAKAFVTLVEPYYTLTLLSTVAVRQDLQ